MMEFEKAKKFVIWNIDLAKTLKTLEEAEAKALAVCEDRGTRVYILEVVSVAERPIPPVRLSTFTGV